MRPFTPLNLQQKFILIATAAMLFLTAAFAILAAGKNSQALQAATEKQGRVLAETVAALIINELIYEKLGLVEEGGLIDNYVQGLFKRKDLDFIYIAVLDVDNRVISHNDFRQYGKIYNTPLLQAAIAGKKLQVGRQRPGAGRENALEFAIPLAIGGKRWGSLLFAVSLKDVVRQTRAIILQISMVAGIASLLGIILIYFLSRRFVRPITELAGVMRDMDVDLNEAEIPIRGNDELAQLGRSFNSMIARLRNANYSMKKAHEKLLQSEKLATLGLLASSVAHRINNPLGGIKNCISMLEKQGDDPAFRRNYLQLMDEGASSIEETVEQLLWTAGKRRGEETHCRVQTVLDSVLRFIDYRMKRGNISFSADIAPDISVAVPPHDLHQILLNIMVNAVQAMDTGGRLHISAQRRQAEVIIRISDNGPGIPPAEMPQLFDLFYTTKKAGEGTGLGLWMTYELVKKYHGDITVESAAGEGTTFIIILYQPVEKRAGSGAWTRRRNCWH